MSDLIQFPFTRAIYPGIDNPVWVSDILAANQGMLTGLLTLLNLPNPGFAIVSGMAYTSGTPSGTYGPGIFVLNGQWYNITTTSSDGQYLTGTTQGVMPEGFDNGTSNPIYTIQVGSAVGSNSGTGPFSPVLAGGMTAYRVGLWDLLAVIIGLQAITGRLQGAAFLPVGTTAASVAAGNDSRFGFTQALADLRYAQIVNVLIEGSTNNNFVPTQPYDPVTKIYSDQSSAKRLTNPSTGAFLSGNENIGSVSNAGTITSISLGTTLANTNYIALVMVVGASSTPHEDTVFAPVIRNKTTTSFDVLLVSTGGETTNVSIDWMLFSLT